MIVIASWVLYHFVAPASWRDGAGPGAVPAFTIALYRLAGTMNERAGTRWLPVARDEQHQRPSRTTSAHSPAPGSPPGAGLSPRRSPLTSGKRLSAAKLVEAVN